MYFLCIATEDGCRELTEALTLDEVLAERERMLRMNPTEQFFIIDENRCLVHDQAAR